MFGLPEWATTTYLGVLVGIAIIGGIICLVSAIEGDWPVEFKDADDRWRFFSGGFVLVLLWPVIIALAAPVGVVMLVFFIFRAWFRLIPNKQTRIERRAAKVEQLRGDVAEARR